MVKRIYREPVVLQIWPPKIKTPLHKRHSQFLFVFYNASAASNAQDVHRPQLSCVAAAVEEQVAGHNISHTVTQKAHALINLSPFVTSQPFSAFDMN